MADKKAVFIHIKYDDGSQDIADGDDAKQILDWYNAGQSMNIIHGAVYKGPQFREIPAGAADPETDRGGGEHH